MLICPANPFDIDAIMAIERNAFIPDIQENQKTFEERIKVFNQGFTLLADTSDKAILERGKAFVCGYFSSEIWDGLPATDDIFKLGHSAKKAHKKDGSVLYISSFALLSQYRGKGLARKFFHDSVTGICEANKNIKTILLLVNEEWLSARHIYETEGFSELRRLPSFFSSLHKKASDGILMICDADKIITGGETNNER